ncbi:MAG: CPBP family intramembrane metalloprotease [Actinomycetota bacterium]|nr:CPBP family intramembrane metalloprotease [Actinomycetota bacterium]
MSSTASLAIFGGILYGSFFISTWFFALKRRGATFRDAGFQRTTLGVLLLMVPVLLAVMFVNGLLLLALRNLIDGIPTLQEQVLPEGEKPQLSDMPWLMLEAAVLAPLVEEFIFRGLLYRYLRGKRGVHTATMLSAFLFAIAHFTLGLVPSLFVLGVVLTVVVERDNSIYPAITLHALLNGTAIAILFAAPA